eukprot:1118514-Prymnesium_polylepis.1
MAGLVVRDGEKADGAVRKMQQALGRQPFDRAGARQSVCVCVSFLVVSVPTLGGPLEKSR